MGTFMSIARLASICRAGVAQSPDLVFLTGDFFTIEAVFTPHSLRDQVLPLKPLCENGRVWAVLGNHDCESDRVFSIIMRELLELGIPVLRDQRIRVKLALQTQSQQLELQHELVESRSASTPSLRARQVVASVPSHSVSSPSSSTSTATSPSDTKGINQFMSVDIVGLDFVWSSERRAQRIRTLFDRWFDSALGRPLRRNCALSPLPASLSLADLPDLRTAAHFVLQQMKHAIESGEDRIDAHDWPEETLHSSESLHTTSIISPHHDDTSPRFASPLPSLCFVLCHNPADVILVPPELPCLMISGHTQSVFLFFLPSVVYL